MKQIPDAAVQAGIAQYDIGAASKQGLIANIITAALPHLQLGNEAKQWGKVRETLAYCDTMFRLDLYKSIEWNGDDLNQAIFDTHERVKQAISIMEDISFIAATLTNDGTKPVDVAAVYREALERISRFDRSHGSWETIAYDAINIAGRALSAAPTPEEER